MKITNTITGKSFETKHTNIKFIKDHIITDEVKFMNEEQKEHYYTSSDFKISK